MYSYITEELPDTVFKNFPEIDAERVSITGHSMGGHGALTLVGLIFECSPFLLLLRKEPMGDAWRFGGCAVKEERKGESAIADLGQNLVVDKMTHTSEHFGISSILVPQKPHKVQICLGLRPHRQPLGLPLGSKSILWLFWHRKQGKMGGSRRHRIGQEMERRESGYLDRCRTSRFLFLLLFNTHKWTITIFFGPNPSPHPPFYLSLQNQLQCHRTPYLPHFRFRGESRMQGTSDPFYIQKQLLPENFERAATDKVSTEAPATVAVRLRLQEGYDHSYFFISSFAEDHVRHAARYLFA